jgi:hypothetical protein
MESVGPYVCRYGRVSSLMIADCRTHDLIFIIIIIIIIVIVTTIIIIIHIIITIIIRR